VCFINGVVKINPMPNSVVQIGDLKRFSYARKVMTLSKVGIFCRAGFVFNIDARNRRRFKPTNFISQNPNLKESNRGV